MCKILSISVKIGSTRAKTLFCSNYREQPSLCLAINNDNNNNNGKNEMPCVLLQGLYVAVHGRSMQRYCQFSRSFPTKMMTASSPAAAELQQLLVRDLT